jgi:hypothetical protein
MQTEHDDDEEEDREDDEEEEDGADEDDIVYVTEEARADAEKRKEAGLTAVEDNHSWCGAGPSRRKCRECGTLIVLTQDGWCDTDGKPISSCPSAS